MHDRARYWKDKLYRLIYDSPGIALTQLALRSKKLTTPDRRQFLEQLLDEHRIRWDPVTDERGHVSTCWWSRIPASGDKADDPLDLARAALEEAKQCFTAGLERIEAALSLLSESHNADANNSVQTSDTAATAA